jgi:hypothetical protein
MLDPKDVMRWLARLYPKVWRERYGEEFEALLQDSAGTFREAADVVIGGCEMHLRKNGLQLAFVVAGLVLGLCVWGLQDTRYIARVEMTGAGDRPVVLERVEKLLSHNSLTKIIGRDDLYSSLRQREPIEAVTTEMKRT